LPSSSSSNASLTSCTAQQTKTAEQTQAVSRRGAQFLHNKCLSVPLSKCTIVSCDKAAA
jgi:hypothetical protein